MRLPPPGIGPIGVHFKYTTCGPVPTSRAWFKLKPGMIHALYMPPGVQPEAANTAVLSEEKIVYTGR